MKGQRLVQYEKQKQTHMNSFIDSLVNKECFSFVDLQTSGALLRIILNLMALADGDISTEEKKLIIHLESQYFDKIKIHTWDEAYLDSKDLKAIAQSVHEDSRLLIARISYMVIASSRKESECVVNSKERDAFNQLTNALKLNENEVQTVIQEALIEMSNQPNLWEILFQGLGNHFSIVGM